MARQFEIFFSYAHEDEVWLNMLKKHISPLKREKLISEWHDREILAGTEWALEIRTHLSTAPIILLLISPDFINSDYCWSTELKQAIRRHNTGEACVIPIIVRPTDWQKAPFAKMQALPQDGKPISTSSDRDAALVQVVQGIRKVIQELRRKSKIPPPSISRETTLSNKPAASESLWNVPFRRNPFFTGREEILTNLHAALSTSRPTAITQPQAISGLGGVGKTQIAVEYAYRYKGEYQAILWVSASSPEELLEEYAKLATVLNLPEQRAQEQQQTILAVRKWLDTHTNWLLIFDNADNIASIYPYLPQEQKGHILLTTRAQTMGGMAQKIEIATMSSEEGVLLLLKRTGILSPNGSLDEATETDRQHAQTIVVDLLDGLPLAIDQAGAYIEETQESLINYITLFQQQRAALLKHRGGRFSLKTASKETTTSDHLPVATTWSMAFEKIEHSTPAAIDLIRQCAFLAPDGISEELLTNGASLLDPPLQSTLIDRRLFNEILTVLLDYSLLERNRTTTTLNMHRLIQAVIQDEIPAKQQISWLQKVISLVGHIFPFDEPAPWPKSQRYIANGLLAISYFFQKSIISDEAMALCNTIGSYFLRRGQFSEAEPFYQHALDGYERMLGSEHPNTLSGINNLAVLYADQGKYEEAEPLYQRALSTRERMLGPEHPDTLSSMNNLAILYKNQGKYEEAELLYQRALAGYERVLGPEHPNTIRVRQNYKKLRQKKQSD